MRLAIIPARGGSKRIPRKNIKDFYGKPMIVWSIEAAINSNCFEKVIVSTDDTEIADIARKNGAHVPFIRPAALSGDYTGTIPVIHHAIDWMSNQGDKLTEVCCIYATAPFINERDIRQGLQELLIHDADYSFSATSYAFPIQRALRFNNEKRIEMLNPENFNTRSQDLEEAFHDAGQFYWGKAESWTQEKMIFSPQSVPVIIPRHRVQDIDSLEDWNSAEWLFKAMQMRHESCISY